jgi:hypothetical protein
VDRLPRPLPALVITAGRGIFRRLELVVRPNIESFTVRLPKFSHWLGASSRWLAGYSSMRRRAQRWPEATAGPSANPVLLCAKCHSLACVVHLPSPFVDTGNATQTNFGHESLSRLKDTLCDCRGSNERTRLADDRMQIQVWFGITPARFDVVTKMMTVRPNS